MTHYARSMSMFHTPVYLLFITSSARLDSLHRHQHYYHPYTKLYHSITHHSTASAPSLQVVLLTLTIHTKTRAVEAAYVDADFFCDGCEVDERSESTDIVVGGC